VGSARNTQVSTRHTSEHCVDREQQCDADQEHDIEGIKLTSLRGGRLGLLMTSELVEKSHCDDSEVRCLF